MESVYHLCNTSLAQHQLNSVYLSRWGEGCGGGAFVM